MIFKNIRIQTERFTLRPLKLSDASPQYLSWMSDRKVAKFILGAEGTQSVAALEAYIQKKTSKADCLFLGIFETVTGEHVGNLKFEPINLVLKSAEMGILIGSEKWRGRGVGPEVILGAGSWLRHNLLLEVMTLGVSSENEAAIYAYKKIGFIEYDSNVLGLDTIIRMSYTL